MGSVNLAGTRASSFVLNNPALFFPVAIYTSLSKKLSILEGSWRPEMQRLPLNTIQQGRPSTVNTILAICTRLNLRIPLTLVHSLTTALHSNNRLLTSHLPRTTTTTPTNPKGNPMSACINKTRLIRAIRTSSSKDTLAR